MYIKKVYKLRHAIEIEEYHTDRYRPPGGKRTKRAKPTPEQMEKANHRNKVKKARRMIRNNFDEGDYYGTLTYAPDRRPKNMQECQKDLAALIRKLRAQYKRKNTELKWMANIEVGSRGAWHIHIIINELVSDDIPMTSGLIRKYWTKGSRNEKTLRSEGGFKKLAEYLTKDNKSDPEHIVESKWSHSRNLHVPDPEIHPYVRRRTWKEEIKVPKGFYLDRDSVVQTINPLTGWEYRTYSLLKEETG